MNKLIIIVILLCSVIFSSNSFAEWKKIGQNVKGSTFYVNVESVRKHNGYIYFWDLVDKSKPDENGYFSYLSYIQGDCNIYRVKTLNEVYHKEPMGRGYGKQQILTKYQKDWIYPSPGTIGDIELKLICNL